MDLERASRYSLHLGEEADYHNFPVATFISFRVAEKCDSVRAMPARDHLEDIVMEALEWESKQYCSEFGVYSHLDAPFDLCIGGRHRPRSSSGHFHAHFHA